MQMLYESDRFIVVHNDANSVQEGEPALPARDGFEIVDKTANTEVYLDGHIAQVFQQQVTAWQANVPEQSTVEAVLDGYCQLATVPLMYH